MKQLILKVNDKTRLSELSTFGYVTYNSPLTNAVGFECYDEKLRELKRHPIVEDCTDACTVRVQ